MNFKISGTAPRPQTATAPATVSALPVMAPAQATKPAPSATVEISSAARQAHSGGPGHAAKHGPRPLNIIWGDSPR